MAHAAESGHSRPHRHGFSRGFKSKDPFTFSIAQRIRHIRTPSVQRIDDIPLPSRIDTLGQRPPGHSYLPLLHRHRSHAPPVVPSPVIIPSYPAPQTQPVIIPQRSFESGASSHRRERSRSPSRYGIPVVAPGQMPTVVIRASSRGRSSSRSYSRSPHMSSSGVRMDSARRYHRSRSRSPVSRRSPSTSRGRHCSPPLSLHSPVHGSMGSQEGARMDSARRYRSRSPMSRRSSSRSRGRSRSRRHSRASFEQYPNSSVHRSASSLSTPRIPVLLPAPPFSPHTPVHNPTGSQEELRNDDRSGRSCAHYRIDPQPTIVLLPEVKTPSIPSPSFHSARSLPIPTISSALSSHSRISPVQPTYHSPAPPLAALPPSNLAGYTKPAMAEPGTEVKPTSRVSSPEQSPSTQLQTEEGSLKLRDYMEAFVTDTLPRQIYLHFLLRLPYIYFSRVERIFKDADLTLEEIKEMALQSCAEDNKTFQNNMLRTTTGPYYHTDANATPLSPAYQRLRTRWESFIDNMMREWKTLNLISVLLLSAIMTMFQIQGAAGDPVTRYVAFWSLICALLSLLYGCLFTVRFATMRKASKAAEWALEARNSQTIFWNVWVMLAMPVIWLSWSIITYIVCIMSFMWRVSANLPPDYVFSVSPSTELSFRIFNCIILGTGVIYGALIINTFRQYGAQMDDAWTQRVETYLANSATAHPPLPPQYVPYVPSHSPSTARPFRSSRKSSSGSDPTPYLGAAAVAPNLNGLQIPSVYNPPIFYPQPPVIIQRLQASQHSRTRSPPPTSWKTWRECPGRRPSRSPSTCDRGSWRTPSRSPSIHDQGSWRTPSRRRSGSSRRYSPRSSYSPPPRSPPRLRSPPPPPSSVTSERGMQESHIHVPEQDVTSSPVVVAAPQRSSSSSQRTSIGTQTPPPQSPSPRLHLPRPAEPVTVIITSPEGPSDTQLWPDPSLPAV